MGSRKKKKGSRKKKKETTVFLPLDQWVVQQVGKFLGDDGGEDLAQYLLSIENEADFRECAVDILGASRDVRNFADEYWRRKSSERVANSGSSIANSTSGLPKEMTALQRGESDEALMMQYGGGKAEEKTKHRKKKKERRVEQKGRGLTVTYIKDTKSKTQGRSRCECMATEHKLVTNCTACGKIMCEMEGEGECFFCGSIVTRDGTVVAEEFVQVMRGEEAKETELDLSDKTLAQNAASLAKAISHKNKLLKFAAMQEKRTAVIDDQADYYDFESNRWLDDKEREKKAEEAKRYEEAVEESKKHRITIDIGAGTVKSHRTDMAELNLQSRSKGGPEAHTSRLGLATAIAGQGVGKHFADRAPKDTEGTLHFSNDTLRGRAKRVYDDLRAALSKSREQRAREMEHRSGKTSGAQSGGEPGTNGHMLGRTKKDGSRLQHVDPFAGDEMLPNVELQGTIYDTKVPKTDGEEDDESGEEMFNDASDAGMCISMHQPWASLLVHGIKRFEGRGWTSDFRGRLWVASTAREPTEEEINELEENYKALYHKCKRIPFPKSYPKSALLGCVDVVDIWPQDKFQIFRACNPELPVEDSESGHLFVCLNPKALRVMQTVRGQHKIWKLKKDTVAQAQAGAKPVGSSWLKPFDVQNV